MVLLDTNVVSELMRDVPSTEVLFWMDERPTRELFVTAVTEAEIRTGIAILPDGARGGEAWRTPPSERSASCSRAGFSRSIATRRVPMPISPPPPVPPGARPRSRTARSQPSPRSRAMAVVTRNVRDFADAGIDVIDPWTDA